MAHGSFGAVRLAAARPNPEKTLIIENRRIMAVDVPIFENFGVFPGSPAFSARLHALGKQPQICAPQISGPRNRGKRVSKGRNVPQICAVFPKCALSNKCAELQKCADMTMYANVKKCVRHT